MEKKNSGSDYFGIGSISVSHCDKYLAYSIDLKGSEYFKIYLRDLGNGKNLEDVIEDTSGSITWSLDNKSFFYSKLDKFHRPRKIYRHFIGSAPENDELIFEEQDETFTCGISLLLTKSFLYNFGTSDHITSEEYFPSNADKIHPSIISKEEKLMLVIL